MKNLLLLLCSISTALIMSSCTVDSLETDSPAFHAVDVTNSGTPTDTPVGDHGHDDKDKDKGNH